MVRISVPLLGLLVYTVAILGGAFGIAVLVVEWRGDGADDGAEGPAAEGSAAEGTTAPSEISASEAELAVRYGQPIIAFLGEADPISQLHPDVPVARSIDEVEAFLRRVLAG